MEFYQHFSVSLVLGLLLSFMFPLGFLESILVLITVLVFGTLVDVDHFLLARYLDGDWEKLKVAVNNPGRILFENEGLIGEKWLQPFLIIKVHLLELSLLLAFYFYTNSFLVLAAVFSLMVHIFCDVVWDWKIGYLGDDYFG